MSALRFLTFLHHVPCPSSLLTSSFWPVSLLYHPHRSSFPRPHISPVLTFTTSILPHSPHVFPTFPSLSFPSCLPLPYLSHDTPCLSSPQSQRASHSITLTVNGGNGRILKNSKFNGLLKKGNKEDIEKRG